MGNKLFCYSVTSVLLVLGSGICQEDPKTKDFHHKASRAGGEGGGCAPGPSWTQSAPTAIPGIFVEQAPEGEGTCGCFQNPSYLIGVGEISGIKAKKMPEFGLFSAVTVTSWFPSPLEFKLA